MFDLYIKKLTTKSNSHQIKPKQNNKKLYFIRKILDLSSMQQKWTLHWTLPCFQLNEHIIVCSYCFFILITLYNLFLKKETYFWTSHLFAPFGRPVTRLFDRYRLHWGQVQNLFYWSIVFLTGIAFFTCPQCGEQVDKKEQKGKRCEVQKYVSIFENKLHKVINIKKK